LQEGGGTIARGGIGKKKEQMIKGKKMSEKKALSSGNEEKESRGGKNYKEGQAKESGVKRSYTGARTESGGTANKRGSDIRPGDVERGGGGGRYGK